MKKYLNKWATLALAATAGLVFWLGSLAINFVSANYSYGSGYSSPSQNSYSTPSQTPQSSQPSSTSVLMTKTDPTLGTYLVDSKGMTLYSYANDSQGMSTCTGQCAINWPPYTVSSSMPLMAGLGVTGTISTITRSDGTMQVTYNGAPLYYKSTDLKPGDTTGQGIGNMWYVVTP